MVRNEGCRSTASLGAMILIGGSEDKDGARVILAEVVRRSAGGKLLVATVASDEPEQQWLRYCRVFRELGAGQIEHLAVSSREEAADPARLEVLRGASTVFFTGGDQVKITTRLGGTPLYTQIRSLYEQRQLLLAGTSAGASAMGETMLVSQGEKEDSHKVEGAFFMARGLGLVHDLVIDQHFAQRARIERLVAAVAENPGVLGIGIDEDTAVILDEPGRFRVVGSGAVYVADGHGVTHTNVSEHCSERTLCLFDLKLHVLINQTEFDLETRRPRFLAPDSQPG